jgi:NADH-quinone oxidoreductase subunit C
LPSLTPIWESANLFERETYEMFGVNFEGHPNLQKLLLQDNWDGPPPLKKDLKIPELA